MKMLSRQLQLARLFFKLGAIGFGGPAVHIATMEDEAVQRRKWMSREHFLDLVGATNLIPGPNSTEIAMHIGYHRAGIPGLLVAGSSFIIPAVLTTTLLAWVYVKFGQLSQAQPLLLGIKPAVLAIIFVALWRLGRKAIKRWQLMPIGALAIYGSLAGYGQVQTLLAVSLVGVVWLGFDSLRQKTDSSPEVQKKEEKKKAKPYKKNGLFFVPLAATTKGTVITALGSAASIGASSGVAASHWGLWLFFLKVGAVLYGSGYVLIAYLEGGLIDQYGWLSQQQLVDAVAIGQLTPGPILSTATFIGFLIMYQEGGILSGFLGAAVASVGIFLPSFFIVAAIGPIIPKLRSNRLAAVFLDVVNVASIGLMAAVTWKLCREVLLIQSAEGRILSIAWQSCLIATIAAAALFRWKLTPAWLVLGGALGGWGLGLLN